MHIAVASTLLALIGLLVAERVGWRIGVWIAKPLASTGFLATAIVAGGWARAAAGDVHAIALIAGLVLSWWGDVLLIPAERPTVFRAGILSFLLGHVAYGVAFASGGLHPATALVSAAVLAIPAVLVLRWLRPSVPPDFVGPVFAYVAVISTMLVCAFATGSPDRSTLVVGALMFYVSDLAVARDRFVSPGFVNSAWGLPLYYGGQLVLAASLSG